MDDDSPPRLPEPRAANGKAAEDKAAKDNPARAYNRPSGAKLLDVPGLLLVLGLAVAGFVVAVLVTRYGL